MDLLSAALAADRLRRLRHVKALAPIAVILLAAAVVHSAHAGVIAYPSSTTIYPSGPLPPGGARALTLRAAVGEREGGLVVVTGARRIAISADSRTPGPIDLRLAFAHFVRFGRRLVPDALLPWDGGARETEQPNQPVYVQVSVPYGTRPGMYRAALRVEGPARAVTLPVSVRVFAFQLPRPAAAGTLLTSFHVSPETYLDRVRLLFGETSRVGLLAANDSLFRLFSSYRLSPASWGFGEPRTSAGYQASAKWWKDSLANMTREMDDGPFSTLRIPISSNRTAPHSYIGGISPFLPETWCPYLQTIRATWQDRGWLSSTATPYLFAYDEPGAEGQRLVARQATAAHRCFPKARVFMTGNPSPSGRNGFLWQGAAVDDVDIWAVLSRRYYGLYASRGVDRSRTNLRTIEKLRSRGKLVFAYTYAGPGTPGFLATEPLSDPRIFMLWTALENLDGVHYGEGTTSYKGAASPLESVRSGGEFVLIYPGRSAPVPSARLEQIRDGVEDWEVLHAIRRRYGGAVVRELLGRAGLFSADRSRVRLGCTVGCELRGPEPFAWPRWSRGDVTPERIESARLSALRLASHP
jgi:hypothetical protein